jgi:hypothetical protein
LIGCGGGFQMSSAGWAAAVAAAVKLPSRPAASSKGSLILPEVLRAPMEWRI